MELPPLLPPEEPPPLLPPPEEPPPEEPPPLLPPPEEPPPLVLLPPPEDPPPPALLPPLERLLPEEATELLLLDEDREQLLDEDELLELLVLELVELLLLDSELPPPEEPPPDDPPPEEPPPLLSPLLEPPVQNTGSEHQHHCIQPVPVGSIHIHPPSAGSGPGNGPDAHTIVQAEAPPAQYPQLELLADPADPTDVHMPPVTPGTWPYPE
ncbi:hypothetical protein AUJ46_06500 [Candidatus Peregrinibacteria bacterium CG1_02_54_53]|nr:MAG: hypothetical protein AUJ46_06500 [Candidatus Peregrinibacteria bacterium CG1_02_54_53]